MASSLEDSVDSSIKEPSSLTETSLDESQELGVSTDNATESNTADESKDKVDEDSESDEDDELLALRIAALESINVRSKEEQSSQSSQKSRSSSPEKGKTGTSEEEGGGDKKPGFQIAKHRQNANLVSILTQGEEILPPPIIDTSRPPPSLPIRFDRPPPPVYHQGGGHRSPGYRPRYRSRSRSRSLSPIYRYHSPRRYGDSPPPYRPSTDFRRSPDGRITPTKRLTPTRPLSPTNRRLTPTRSLTPPPLSRRSPPPMGRYSPARRSPGSAPMRSHGGGLRRSPGAGRRSPGAGGRRSPYSYRRHGRGGRSPGHRGNNFRREPLRPRADNRQHKKAASPVREPSLSEWETDTDPPTDEEDNNTTKDKSVDTAAGDQSQDSVNTEEQAQGNGDKSQEDNKENDAQKEDEDKKDESKEAKSKEETELGDHSQDDVLKLDASAEVDEFSKFLNEIEEEVLNDKPEKKEETVPSKPEKKPRIETERKTVDGKKLRKKIKPKKEETPSFSDEDSKQSSPVSLSHRFGGGGNRRYSNERREATGRRTDKWLEQREKGNRGSWPRDGLDAGNRGSRPKEGLEAGNRGSRPKDGFEVGNRGSRPRDDAEGTNRGSKPRETEGKEPRESSEDRRERERKEYEEKLSKLPSPEREKMEARRKKFESKGEVEVKKPVKISLKRDTTDMDDTDVDVRSRIGGRNSRSNVKDEDTWRRDEGAGGRGGDEGVSQVTDLRVQLHKRKQARGEEDEEPNINIKISRKSAERNNRKSVERNGNNRRGRRTHDVDLDSDGDEEEVGDEDRVPPLTSTHRIIIPRVFKNENDEEDEEMSDRSPSPPPVIVKKRKKSGDKKSSSSRKVKVRADSDSVSLQNELEELKALKDIGFTEEEIQKEMNNIILAKQAKKLKKKDKKEKKDKKDKKKKKKKEKSRSSRAVKVSESDEEDDLDHFARMLEEEENQDVFRSRSRSRFSSGDKSSSRPSSGLSVSDEMKITIRAQSAEKSRKFGDSLGSKLKLRLGNKVMEEKTDSDLEALVPTNKLKRKSRELQNVAGDEDDLMERMRKKNKKREERAREIEQDKKMHGY